LLRRSARDRDLLAHVATSSTNLKLQMAAALTFTVVLRFRGDLPVFLRRSIAGDEISKTLREKTSVKDVLESCGVPHTEVDGILVGQRAVDFQFHLRTGAVIDVFGFPAPDVIATPLQHRGVRHFVADGHLGKLVRRLRVLGIDVAYDKMATDAQLVAVAAEQGRALLTRDRRLLMHAAVQDGYWLRSQSADEQAAEVVRRFDLRSIVRPFTRCPNCNGELQRVSKAEVLEQLQPLTRIYYEDFQRCGACGQVYWAGSHAPKLEAQLARLGVTNWRCESNAER
jgi:uncharacterized protein with PIN domain